MHRDFEDGELPGIALLPAAHGVVRVPDGPEVLDPGLLEIGQIGRMMDDPHRIGLGETSTEPVRERVVRRIARRLQGLAGHDPRLLPCRAGRGPGRPMRSAAARCQTVHPVLIEDGELALGLDRDHAALHDATLAEDAAFGDVRHPSLEHGFLVGECGAHVAQGQRDGGPTEPTIALAAVRMMSKVAASTAPCTHPGAPS